MEFVIFFGLGSPNEVQISEINACSEVKMMVYIRYMKWMEIVKFLYDQQHWYILVKEYFLLHTMVIIDM